MWMMHAEQRQCILYTANDSPLPVYSVHLYCEGMSLNSMLLMTLLMND